MGSPELAQYADFYADTTDGFALTDNLSLWRDISERLHQLTSEPEDVTYRDVTANGVPAILVMPADSSTEHILLHSHSGGSVTASMWQERKAVGHLAKAAGSRALVINYRLAPEDKFPAQIDDVEAAYRWLLDQGYDPSQIASTGDSIGGNYAANLALTLQRKKAPLPGAVLSISPWFDMELKNKSVDTRHSSGGGDPDAGAGSESDPDQAAGFTGTGTTTYGPTRLVNENHVRTRTVPNPARSDRAPTDCCLGSICRIADRPQHPAPRSQGIAASAGACGARVRNRRCRRRHRRRTEW